MNKRPPLRRSAPVEQENDGIIEGRNAVIEAQRPGGVISTGALPSLIGPPRGAGPTLFFPFSDKFPLPTGG